MYPELEKAASLASAYLDDLDYHPVSQPSTVDELRVRLDHALTDDGVPGVQVLEELARDIDTGLLRTSGGRFFGWVIGGGVPAAIGADWLCSTWDQNAAAYACSPGAAVVEEIAGRWLKEMLGLPATASFSFVTGCQMAHVVCLAAARHHVLSEAGWNVEEDGLFGAPPIRVLVGEHHETLVRALRYLGIGSNAMVRVGCHSDGTIDINALATELDAASGHPTIVSLAAGDLNRGAFDDFEHACEAVHAHGGWVHVDGAFGLWVGASPTHRHLVKGIGNADSWATDAHKWLNVPYENGIGFVARWEAHRAAMRLHADYVIDAGGGRDQLDWNPEWSRRARAVPIYVALRTLGRHGVAHLVERCCRLTAQMVRQLATIPGVEVLTEPIINQALVRFPAPGGASSVDHDRHTESVVEYVQHDGEAWFGPTTWQGMRVMRISVSNWRTSGADVTRAVDAVARAVAALRPRGAPPAPTVETRSSSR